jgi:sugar lactone lactonase YvrE
VSLIANLTHIVLPDGVATLPYDPSMVLVADAAQGIVWRINTADGKYSQAIDDPVFKPTDAVPLGVNGIRIQDDGLYFTNLATNTVGRIAITPDGKAAGPVQLLTSKALAADDFALSDNGTVYAAGFNTLWQVTADGRTTAFVGGPNSTVLQGITSARFGRTAVDKDVLYMSTEGGLLADPPGSTVHGGQLVAVNVNAVNSGDEDSD